MGQRVETLADLLRPGLLAVCVGFNPTPISVKAGHYYQGKAGQDFMERLRQVGLLPKGLDGWEDDLLFERSVGFTDMVKRPTPSAREVLPEEYEYGVPRLAAKLEMHATRLVIFSFEMAAPRYFGRPVGCGFLKGLSIGTAEVFVMPWVRKGAARATKARAALADWVKAQSLTEP